MMSVAPDSVLLLGVIGMLVVAFSVLRMLADEHSFRGPLTASRVPETAPRTPLPAHGAHP